MHLYFTFHLFWVTIMNLEQLVAICAFYMWVTDTVNTILCYIMRHSTSRVRSRSRSKSKSKPKPKPKWRKNCCF
ncbi:hypothetical protein RJT34_11145 [Clitoria ternatea]|uniref:Uncharacterized protein n=1 Tax=Clitoria ternatea TaxID=43366 RepID=A0AAN9PK87_CLITE